MKNCIDCIYHSFVNGCLKDLKPQTCKKYKPIPIEDLQKEQRKLYSSGENPERLKYLNKKIDYFNWGIQ